MAARPLNTLEPLSSAESSEGLSHLVPTKPQNLEIEIREEGVCYVCVASVPSRAPAEAKAFSPAAASRVTIQLSAGNTFLGGAGNRKEAKGMVLNHQDHYKPATQGRAVPFEVLLCIWGLLLGGECHLSLRGTVLPREPEDGPPSKCLLFSSVLRCCL